MRTVRIGPSGIESSAIGLGCMGMSEFYGTGDDAESRRVIDRALALGLTHFDTSDIYGRGHNEALLGAALKGRRDRALISTKFGILRDPDGPPGSTYDRDLDNSPAHMRKSIEGTLKRLGTDHVDLYYLHRHDPAVPIEDVVGAMGGLVAEGKVRGLGLSEVDAPTLARAAATHPIAALQSEYSLWERGAEAEVLPMCRDHGITLVAYSPLGRGFLTGAITGVGTLPEGDLRKSSPRFMDGNIERNLALLERIGTLADRHGCTLGQVALAWILCQSPSIVPIPGTKRQKYLEENIGAVSVALSPDEIASLSAIMDPDAIAGSRHWVPRGGSAEGAT